MSCKGAQCEGGDRCWPAGLELLLGLPAAMPLPPPVSQRWGFPFWFEAEWLCGPTGRWRELVSRLAPAIVRLGSGLAKHSFGMPWRHPASRMPGRPTATARWCALFNSVAAQHTVHRRSLRVVPVAAKPARLGINVSGRGTWEGKGRNSAQRGARAAHRKCAMFACLFVRCWLTRRHRLSCFCFPLVLP